MEVTVSEVIKDLEGKGIGNDEAQLTVGVALVNSLLAMNEEEKNLGGEEKLKRYILSRKIHEAGDVIDLKAEEAALCKKLVGMMYSPLVSGQVWMAIDPE